MHINAWRNVTTDPIENNHLAVCDETSLVSPDDNLASDLFMPGAKLMQYGLSDHNAAKHRWYYFPKMQMVDVLLFKQFDSDTVLPGRMSFHTAFVDPTVRASSAAPFCSSLTLSPTPVQLCLPMQWRRRLPLTPSAARGTSRWSASCQSGCGTTRTPKCLSDACS